MMLYVRCPLSLGNVEDLLHERGIDAGITLFATVANSWEHKFRPHQQADVSSHWSASFYRFADQSEVG